MNNGIRDFKTVLQVVEVKKGYIELRALRCKDCKKWAGRCLKEKKNRVASSRCCEDVDPR